MDRQIKELYEEIKEKKIISTAMMQRINELRSMKSDSEDAKDSGCEKVNFSEKKIINYDAALDYFKEILSSGIKLPAYKIEEDAPMERYGIDSVMVLNLTQNLEKVFGSLPKTLFFEYQTIGELTGYFIEKHSNKLGELLGVDFSEKETETVAKIPEELQKVAKTQEEPEKAAKTPEEPEFFIKKEKNKKDRQHSVAPDFNRTMDVAIIGLSGKYPKANDLDQFWENLKAGMDCVTEIPKERWDYSQYFDPDKNKEGKTCSKWGGFLDGVYNFDPLFFQISPREAGQMDPQERLFLECVYKTLEDAGYTKEACRKYKKYGLEGNIGVFVGVMYEEYQLYAAQEQARGNMISVYGNPASIANRVSYYFDFHGPCMAVDTMCSSSLTAIHLAYQSLLHSECEMAIAGGVNISIHPNKYLLLGKNKFMSSKGKCESFGENGDGYVPGEGVGAVLLKPLEKAIEDGDVIYGILKSTCINHGGKTNGFTVPNPKAQAQVMKRAYGEANMNPRLVSYIEAHGTGTSLGDPIEITGLNKTFREYTKDSHFCRIGSVKSNIGHLESASGIASLTKVLLQMKYRKLVPSIHSEILNPNIDFDDTPFVVQRELEDWNRPVLNLDGEEKEYPRIAGISSFGAGGSNAHIVVEEYVQPSKEEVQEETPYSKQLFVINGKNKNRLKENVQGLIQYVDKAISDKAISDKAGGALFADMAYTLQIAREAMTERLAVEASNFEELSSKLKQFVNEEEYISGTYYNNVKTQVFRRVFEGQASTVFLKTLMQGKEFDKIGQLWVSGIDIDWELLYQDEAGYQPYRISLPGYSFAQEKYFPKITQPEQVDMISTPATDVQEQSKADYFYVPKWKQEEITSKTNVEEEKQCRNIVIIYPEDAERLSYAISLAHAGDRVIKVKQVKIEQKISDDCYEIDIVRKSAYQKPMEEIDSIDVVYYLGGIETRQKDLMDLSYLDEFKEQSVIGLLRLIKSYAKCGHIRHKTEIKIVTNHVYKVAEADKLLPYAAGLFGLGKSIEKEFRSCNVTGIDVDFTGSEKSEELQQLAEMIRIENTSLSLGTTAIRKGLRYVQKLYQLDLPVQNKTQFRDGGVYFILGGAGGIGLELCLYLAKRIHCKFVLVGRRDLADIPKKKINEIQESGSEVLYITADATDEPSMLQAVKKAKEAFGKVNGVIHSAIVLKDQALLNMEEETFSKVLDPKMRGSIVLYKVFKEEPLDFKLYFSSVQSFAGNGGQSNYAAGCTFKDAFAFYEEENSLYSVKLINWGYWGEVGVVANEEYNNRLKALGIYSLKTSDGMKAVESILNFNGLQVLAIKADQSAMEKMGADFGSKVLDTDDEQEGFMEQALLYEKMPILDHNSFNHLEDAFWQLRKFTQLLTLNIFQKAGIFIHANERYEKQELFIFLEILQKYNRLFGAMLDIMENAGFIQRLQESQYLSNEIVESQEIKEPLSNLAEKKNGILQNYPSITAYVEFLWTCMPYSWEIFRGIKMATEIIFPNSSMKLVEKIYKDNQLSDYMNEVVAWTLVSYVNRRKGDLIGNEKIKILEIGAGTGGTSSVVFKKLKQYQDIVTYDYTDISEAFMKYGKSMYGAENPYVNYKLFNVEKDPIVQAYESGTYDVVIATNVLHATKNIKNTIRNAKVLLRKNGWIVMNEITKVEDFLTLTFGLLDGWWLYEDASNRLSGSPLLSNQLWAEALTKEGYRNVKTFGQKKDSQSRLMQNIIVAESNGEIYLSGESDLADTTWQPKKIEQPIVKTEQPVVKTETAFPVKENVLKKAFNKEEVAVEIEEAILDSLSFVLQVDKSELDIEMPYTEYGMDSILSGQVTNLINDKLNIEMNSTVLFNYPNTSKLRDYILSSFKDKIVQFMEKQVEADEQVETEKQYEVDKQYEPNRQDEADGYLETEKVKNSGMNDNIGTAAAETKSVIRNELQNGSMDIAIVGMSGVFPGADTLEEYWDNLTRGVDSVTTIDRWNEKDYFEPDPDVPNKSYINRSGLLRGMKEFDPLFFNISPKEAEFMDPQQRLFLEAAWSALEDAGYNDKYLDERKCGVFVGCMEDYYEKLIEESGADKNNYIFTGTTIPILSARISYFLNLRGPSIVVSTACSSALVALHLACESIINKTSEIAIAGGINVLATPMFHVLGSSTGMFSYTNEIRPFDNAADGFIPAEGCGAFVLKPLKKAKKDGDHIYGVIVGSGINQDGKSNGITAPSAPSQAALECEVYEKYKINPEHISYIEAHGTGTRLGDPIEIEALRDSFSKFTDKKQFCAIGSVKSNIGHALQAAGSASLAKVLLCLKYKKLVPSIHFQSENELIPFKDSPVYVNTEYKDWIPAEGAPRMAAISAFGISGTNSHVVIKEYDETDQKIIKEESYYLIALSAKTKEQLAERVTDLKEWLHKENKTNSLGNIANTLMTGRCHFSYRMALIVNSIQELTIKLENVLNNKVDSSLITGDFISNTFRADVKTKQYGQELIDGMAQGLYTRKEYNEKLTDVAKLYVKGYLFDWTGIYNTNYYKKISLPTYPFSNASYWIQNHNKYQEKTSSKPDRLHPLVGANTATLKEQKYTTLFSINEFYIQGHQIENEKVMPGVVYLEMARAAGTMAAEENVKSIKDVIWGSPITIKETKEVFISLYPKEEEQVEFTVYTEDADERTVHAKGILLYEYDKIEEHTFSIDALEVRKRCNTHFTGEDCYEMFESLGFHYDKNFQSIHNMYSNEKEVLAYLKLPEGLSEDFETFQIHPSIMDGALQAAIGLVRNYNNNSSSIYLPFLIEKIDLMKPLTKECMVYVTLASEHMTQGTNGFIFHVTVTNMDGEVLAYVNKYVVREFSQKHVEQKMDDTFEIMDDTFEIIDDTFEIMEAESLSAWED